MPQRARSKSFCVVTTNCCAGESFDVSTVALMPAALSIPSSATAAFWSLGVLVNSTRTEPFQPSAFASVTSRLAVVRSYLGPATPGSHGKLFWNSVVSGRPLPE